MIALVPDEGPCALCGKAQEGIGLYINYRNGKERQIAMCGGCLLAALDATYGVGLSNVYRVNLAARKLRADLRSEKGRG